MFIARIALEVDDLEAFRRHAALEVVAVRALPGCVTYRFCQDVTTPSEVLLYEEWSSASSFEAYKSSPLFEEISAGLMPLLTAPPKSAYYESDDLFEARTCARAPATNGG